jgi:hypothetical protein
MTLPFHGIARDAREASATATAPTGRALAQRAHILVPIHAVSAWRLEGKWRVVFDKRSPPEPGDPGAPIATRRPP